jgi:hypothetical protein
MAYLILNGPSYRTRQPASCYRGTDRRAALYFDALPDDQEINRLFKWYINEMHPVSDLAQAFRYVELARTYLPDHHFEVIEVTKGDATPINNGEFLGFDLSGGGSGDSLIFMCLPAGFEATNIPAEPIHILSGLIRRYFTPRLNQFGLFQEFEDAVYCREAMIALQSFHPNLYEGGALVMFEVAGVYSLSEK